MSGDPILAAIANLDAKLDQVAKDVAQGLRILITENNPDAIRAGLAKIADALDVLGGSATPPT